MATTDLMFPPPKGGDILPLLRDDDKGNQNGNEKEHETADVVSMYHGNCGSEITRVGMLRWDTRLAFLYGNRFGGIILVLRCLSPSLSVNPPLPT